jgi:TRAP transporter TAXI family solute receptor
MMMINLFEDKCHARCFKLSFVLAVWLIVMLAPPSSFAFDIRIGTEESGSFSHFSGRTICRIIEKQLDELQCTVVPADGHVHNLTNLQGGSLDLCIVDSRMLFDAVAGKGLFEFFDISYDNLREIMSLYELPVSVVVRSTAGINSLSGLIGKRINAGAPRSQQHLATQTIMEIKNWSEKDFSLFEELPSSLSQDTMSFCYGSIQAMINIAVHPDPKLQQLFKLCKAQLLSLNQTEINAIRANHPAFIQIDIAPNTYAATPQAVQTFGTTMKLVTSDSLDEETVYQIITALDQGQRFLKNAHPALDFRRQDAAVQQAGGIPIHPGAVKYFNEQ